MTTPRKRGPRQHRLAVPVIVVLVLAALVVAVRVIPRDTGYHAELPHAAGLRAGDAVRVAGLEVGRVTSVTAKGDTVHVDFTTSDDVELTTDTRTQVKLVSLLGKRYLELDPGEGEPLESGDTLDKAQADTTYTLERFWLDATPEVEALDLALMEKAIDTLSTDLRGRPGDLAAALDGMTEVSGIVSTRDGQLDRLLESTRAVTDLLVDQQDELVSLMTDADLVMTMVYERREALRLLLHDSRDLVVRLTSLVRDNQAGLGATLRDARKVLRVLTAHKADLDRTLELAGPAMRFFTNGTGDGPWLGVNSPYFVFPDDLICTTTRPEDCT
ncbi:ABC transporter substrate-binding protein [Nocardioides szechwanensis]|uniref:Phospholipid/cholesterol/gamma-HCH transport system substrate-binding protein n=1 Tax=Nocardioides szechwanensis TaxID=1005944 RepID=A0A1H0G1U7_9ACTN|nr:MCE family protein [Nocardioides szechwanensis]GEP35676.1 ABC transporter substrate-binding protein [Nocardioides szechwanensis]SDO00867.1 phospholipid/cholesterol/gamma-HCH transport system substrate-binding protein [Nocardioides szechwanensis]